jgi:cytoskeletal protein CcmA (bactofilin family)
MATGSIGDLTAPVIFIGDSAVAGGYKPVSKIYQGTTAPDLTSNNWGTTMNGTPFYSTGNKSLNILNNAGNTRMDLTGNIEGNTIVGVTITSLSSTNITGSNGNFTNLTGLTFTSRNSNITALTGSHINVTNITGTTITGSNARITGDLSVEGAVYVTGDISGSDLNLTGNATIDGDIVLKGNINIGNQTTDLITFGGEVSSSILPQTHNAFDLGSPSLNWKNLHISGTAFVDTLQARQVNFSDLGILQDLSVSGNTFLGNGGDHLVVSGSIYNDQLTNNRVVIVGVDGLIEDDANFTFDGTELSVGQGNFTVQQGSGNVYSAGTIDVYGESTFGSAIVQDLTSGRIVLAGTGGAIEDSANLTFDGTTFKIGVGQLEIDNADGDIRTSGSLTVRNGLSVTGTTTIQGNETVNGILTVTGETRLGGNLFVSGNLEVLGTSTNVSIQSSTINLNDNIILVNAYSPFEKYAGLAAYDSGSVGGSGSMLWDSLNDYWLVQNAGGTTSKVIGSTTGSMGSEVSLTNNTIPKATSANTIGDSLLTDNATTLTYNTNKFTVASSDGATLIAGNVTLSSGGGADANSKTSAIVFKNSSNVLGYVSTTETTDVLDGILGYKNSNGGLVFSTVIDGGTY